ncbi:MAG: F0F1 ATP synthase subunit alpha [Alphaproteobacteria bacterium]|nr:F0F1 ATP synthase subunit alpha [Alphaproteobacteria bacterium]
MAVRKKQKKVSVVVESVQPLSDKQQNQILQKIKSVFQTEKAEARFDLNPELLGGLTVKMNGELLDLSKRGELAQFASKMEHYKTDTLDLGKMADVFQRQIDAFRPEPTLSEVGRVLSVSDGVAKVEGLQNLMSGECVRFKSGAEGMALNLNPTTADVVIFEGAEDIKEGESVFAAGKMNTIPVGMSLLGRVLSPLGEPLDDKEGFESLERYPVFNRAPGIVDRDKVVRPVQTGIKAIDALVPIGRGQRELIIGDRQTGKTTLILDTIINQKKYNDKAGRFQDKLFCIYVAIGQKQSTIREILETLKKQGAMDYTIIVSAPASTSAVMQYLAPYAGCAVGEYFRNNGMNAIVFYDDLSKHAVAYREMSLLLKRPAGREAYPGDVFYLHSRLLERAAQMSAQKGGGSLTAVPVVETQEGDVSAYIPTNVISITDGQIFLESNLFHQGIRPAVNVGLSVSRVGSAAQSKAMKKLSGSLKLELSQYREVLNFAQLSSDLDEATKRLLNRGGKLTEVMKQKPFKPLGLGDELLALFMAVNGYLDDMDLAEVASFCEHVTAYVRLNGHEVMGRVDEGILTDKETEKIKELIQNYRRQKQEAVA